MSNDKANTLGEPRALEDLAASARRMIEAIQRGEDPMWDGPELEWLELLITGYRIQVDLLPERLESHADRGRDALDVAMLIILRVGIEQGARVVWDRLRERRQGDAIDDVFLVSPRSGEAKAKP